MREWVSVGCLEEELRTVAEKVRRLSYNLVNPPWYIAWYITKRDQNETELRQLSQYMIDIKIGIQLIKEHS